MLPLEFVSNFGLHVMAIVYKVIYLGAFGISRYKLDYTLKILRRRTYNFRGCKAEDVSFNDELFSIQTTSGEFS
jgi:hypothetical protein